MSTASPAQKLRKGTESREERNIQAVKAPEPHPENHFETGRGLDRA